MIVYFYPTLLLLIGKEKIPPSGFGIVGGLLTAAAGAVTVATSGAAAVPIGVLAVSGTGSGIISGVLNISNIKENVTKESELIKEIKEVLIIDAEAVAYFNNMCEQIFTKYSLRNDIIFHELRIVASEFGCVAILQGVEEAISVLATIIVNLKEFISPETLGIVCVSAKVLSEIFIQVSSNEVAGYVGKKAGEKVAQEVWDIIFLLS